jgi:membrane-associated phospholipid phosphatase
MTTTPRVLAGVCAASFALVYAVAFALPEGRRVDSALYRRISHTELEQVRLVGANTLDTIDVASVLLVGGALVVVALVRGRIHRAVVAAGAVLLPIATSEILKPALGPLDRALAPHRTAPLKASFPSGHATVAMALALSVVVVAPRALRAPVAFVGAVYAAAVGISLVALGWHYPSDVLAGFLVAAAWAAVAVAVLRAWGERPESARAVRRRELAGVAAAGALAVAFAVVLGVILARHPQFTDALRIRRSLVGTTAVVAVSSAVLVAATAVLAREPVRAHR